MFKAPWRAFTALALLAAIGCGDDGGTDPEGSISISASPSALTVPAGGTGTVNVTLTRGGGFAEAVNVTVEGLPAGVTASVNPAQLTGTTSQAVVTVSVASTVAAGTYTSTIRASAAGIGSATTTYALTVTAAANYTLSATAASVQQGGSGTSTISIQRTNFTGGVALTLENPPAGITGTFNPTPATGDQSVLTINVAGTVAPGTYNLTVKGSATGPGDKTTTVALTVTAAPAANYTLSVTPTSVNATPGGTAQATVNIARSNFTGTVNLALDAPPAGITATFNPAAATGNTSTATINVDGTAVPNTYNITIKGTATGIADKTATLAVVVGASGTFSILASPSTVTAAPGGNATSTVAIVRTNFTTDVALSLVSPPAGITGTFTPATLTGTTLSSQLQLTVPANATAGTYPVTVQGVGGTITQTTTVNVTVSGSGGGSFTISASPTTVNATPGGNGTTTVTIARTNFTTDVALSLVNPPTGITGAFTPATLTGTTLTSSLQLNVAANVAAGTYPVTVQGVGGAVTQTTTVNVTVSASAAVTLAMSPTSVSIQQGQSGSSTLTATRTNFTGDITPSVTGNPAGMTVTFNPNPITGNTSTVTVNVGSGVAVGSYPLTITGATGTAGNPTTTLTVVVTAATGGSNLTWDFCTADGVPLRFWRQSGGTWAEVTPTVVGNVTRFAFSIASTSGGVAFTLQGSSALIRNETGPSKIAAMLSATRKVREQTRTATRLANQTLPQATTFFDTYVQFGLTSELGSYAEVCVPTVAQVSKTFNVSGIGANEVGVLGYGEAFANLAANTPSYNLMVQPGSYDWAAAFGPAPALPDFSSTWTAYRLGRNETAPGSAVSINRTGATAFTTVPFTVTGASPGSFNLFSESISGSRGAILTFTLGSLFASSSSGNMLFFAPADRLPTDLTLFNVTNLAQSGNNTDLRGSLRYFGTPPASATFALPSAVPAFTVTQVNGAPVTTWSATGAIPAEYQTSVSPVTVIFEGAGGTAYVTVSATRGWLLANNMATSYTLTQPTLPNFQSAWAPAAPLVSTAVVMLAYDELAVPTAGSTANFGARVQMP